MKYIVNESQLSDLESEKKADILYKLLQRMYPNNYIDYNEDKLISSDIDIISGDDLLFFYNSKLKEFYIGTFFINEIFDKTGLPFFDYVEIQEEENREMFNELVKTFAKKYYGWNVDTVYFHYY